MMTLLCVFVSLCLAQDPVNVDPDPGEKIVTYTAPDNAYTLTVPPGWRLASTDENVLIRETTESFLDKELTNAPRFLLPNDEVAAVFAAVSINLVDLGRSIAIDEDAAVRLQTTLCNEFESMGLDVDVEGFRVEHLADRMCCVGDYELTGDLASRQRQVYFGAGKKMFVATYCASSVAFEELQLYLPLYR